MKPLEPIPIPVARRWKEFRLRVLPGLIFLAVLGSATALWQQVAQRAAWSAQILDLVLQENAPRPLSRAVTDAVACSNQVAEVVHPAPDLADAAFTNAVPIAAHRRSSDELNPGFLVRFHQKATPRRD